MLVIFTVSFFGHRQIDEARQVVEQLDELVRRFIREKEYVDFLVGRNGEFDQYAASAVRLAKKDIDDANSSLILVLPYRVVSPHNTLFSDGGRQLFECRDNNISFRRDVPLDIGAVGVQRELEIVIISPQFVYSSEHWSGVRRPENNAVNYIRRQGHSADLMMIHRAADIYESLSEPVKEPFGIVRRDIRPPACAYYHKIPRL